MVFEKFNESAPFDELVRPMLTQWVAEDDLVAELELEIEDVIELPRYDQITGDSKSFVVRRIKMSAQTKTQEFNIVVLREVRLFN